MHKHQFNFPSTSSHYLILITRFTEFIYLTFFDLKTVINSYMLHIVDSSDHNDKYNTSRI